MKHSIWMRLALIVLSVSMVLSLAACKPAGNEETTGKETEQKTEATTAVDTEATTEDDGEETTEVPVETTTEKTVETTEKKPVVTTEKKPAVTTEKKEEPVVEADPLNVFVKADALANASVNSGRIEKGVLSSDGKYVTFANKADGADGWMLGYTGGSVVSGQYLVIKYRFPVSNQTKATTIEIFCSTANAGPTGGDNVQLPVIADGEWHIGIVDMAKSKGAEKFPANSDGTYTIKYARFDVLNGSHKVGDTVDVAYVGIDNSLADALALVKAEGMKSAYVNVGYTAYETYYASTGTTTPTVEDVLNVYVAPDKMTGASVNANRISGKELSADGKYITFTANGTGGDGYALLYSGGATVSGQYIVFKYRYHAENAYAQTYIEIFTSCTNGGATGGDNIRVEAVADGEWHVAVADVSTLNTKFVANDDGAYIAKYARFDIFDGGSTGEGDKIDIAYIGYADSIDNILKANKDVKKIYYKLGNDAALKYTLYTSTGTTDPAMTDVAKKYFDAEDIAPLASKGTNIGEVVLSEDGSYVSVYGKGKSDGYFVVFSGNTDVTGQYLVMKYRYPTTNAENYKPANRSLFSGNVYGGPTGDDTSNSFPVVSDGEWHMTVFNLAANLKDTVFVANEDGTYSVKYLRFDLGDNLPEDCCIDIQYIALTDVDGLNNMIAVAKGEGLETVTAKLDENAAVVYYTATGTTEPPAAETETGTGDETETESEAVVDPGEGNEDVVYDAPYFKFSTEYINGKENVRGGTNSVAVVDTVVNVYSNGTVNVSGWMMAWDGVEKYQYSFDGGNTWIDIPEAQYYNIERSDLVTHITANESAILSTNFKKNGIFNFKIPVSEYHAKNVVINVCAIVTGGDRVEFLQLLNVKVAHAPDASTAVDNGDGTHTLYCGVEGCGAVALVEKHTEGDVKYFEDEKAYYSYCSKCADVPLGKVGPLKVYYEGGEFGESVVSKGKSEVSCIYIEGDKAPKEYTDEDGTVYTRVTISKNGDIYFYPWKTSSFSKVTGQYMVFKYRYQKDGTSATEFNFYTSTERTTANGSAESLGSYNPKLYDDGEWHIAVVDLSVVSEFNMKDGAYHVGHVRFGFGAGDVDSYIDVAYWGLDDDLAHVANLIDRTELGTEAGKTQHDHYLVPVTGDDIPAHTSECVICGIRQTVDHTLSDVQYDATTSQYVRNCTGCDYTAFSPLNVYYEGGAVADKIIADGGALGIYTEGEKMTQASQDGTYSTVTFNGNGGHTYFYPWKHSFRTLTTGQYFVMKYRLSADATTNANFTIYTSTIRSGASGEKEAFRTTPLRDDAQWHIVIADLSSAEEFTVNADGVYKAGHIRLGFDCPVDGATMDIAFMGIVDNLANVVNVIDKTELGTETGKTQHDHYLVPVTGEDVPAHTSKCVICEAIQTVDHTWVTSDGYNYICSENCGASYTFTAGSEPTVYVDAAKLASTYSNAAVLTDTDGTPYMKCVSSGDYYRVLYDSSTGGNKVTGKYLVVKYRLPIDSTASTMLIWSDTTRTGADGTYSNRGDLSLTKDGQWHIEVIDISRLSAAGETQFLPDENGDYRAGYLRVHPTGSGTTSGRVIHLQYIAMFTTVEEAAAFDSDLDYMQYRDAVAGHRYDIQSNGKLVITTEKITSLGSHTVTPYEFDDGFKYVNIKAASTTGDQYTTLVGSAAATPLALGCKYIGVLYQAPEYVKVGNESVKNNAGGTQFLGNCTKNQISSSGDGHVSTDSYTYITDGKWHMMLIDVSKIGVVDKSLYMLRWDYFNGGHIAGAEINVANMGFYASQGEAIEFYTKYVEKYDLVCGHDGAKTWTYVENDKDDTDALFESAVCAICGANTTMRKAKFIAHTDFVWINGTDSSWGGNGVAEAPATYNIAEGTVISSSVGMGAWGGASNQIIGAAYYRILDENGNVVADWTKLKDINSYSNDAVNDHLYKNYTVPYGFTENNAVYIGTLKVDFTTLDVKSFSATENLVVEYALTLKEQPEGLNDKYFYCFKIANIDLDPALAQ